MVNSQYQANSSLDRAGSTAIFFILVGVILVFGMLFWHLRHNILVNLWLSANIVVVSFPAFFSTNAESLQAYMQVMKEHANVVTFHEMMTVTNMLFRFYLPVALLVPAYGIWLAYRDPVPRLTVSLGAQELLERMSKVFPGTTPILNRDLNFDNSKEWSSSVSPDRFAKQYKLIKKHRLLKDRAELVFKRQLGLGFKVEALRPYEKALFAVFAARLARDIDAAQSLLDNLSTSSVNGPPDYSLADDLFEKHKEEGVPFAKIHHHTRTILCSMFEASKIRGKISPSMFLWLKPVDRTLWYALNRVGAQTPFVEAAGVWDHLKAEQTAFTGEGPVNWFEFFAENEDAGKPEWRLMRPAYKLKGIWVRNAINALEDDLKNSGIVKF